MGVSSGIVRSLAGGVESKPLLEVGFRSAVIRTFHLKDAHSVPPSLRRIKVLDRTKGKVKRIQIMGSSTHLS